MPRPVPARAALAAALLAALPACATIMQSASQEISVSSTPTGAKVLVDGTDMGKTPYVASLKRKDKHVIRIELAGYQPFEMPLGRGTSGWVWGQHRLRRPPRPRRRRHHRRHVQAQARAG
ncbi:MAG: PEGA domain-containing protein [Gemmatimonadetes bacterium]|nr:PEGA domain-containing protein [Gemmatimonadota bacterium]